MSVEEIKQQLNDQLLGRLKQQFEGKVLNESTVESLTKMTLHALKKMVPKRKFDITVEAGEERGSYSITVKEYVERITFTGVIDKL